MRPRPIITMREGGRFLWFVVALIKRKRKQRGWSMALCAAWAGISADMWRKIEKRTRNPGGRTLVLMIAAVNLTLFDIVVAANRRHLRQLRVIAGVGQLSQ